MRTDYCVQWLPPAHALALCIVPLLCAACAPLPAAPQAELQVTPGVQMAPTLPRGRCRRLCDFGGFWKTADATLARVRKELDRCAKPNTTNGFRQTPLMLAVLAGKDAAFIATLLEAGADPNATGIGDFTALLYAAANNPDPAVVTALIQAGADLNATSRDGFTVLDLAAVNNSDPAVIDALIQADADPTVTRERMRFGVSVRPVTAEAAQRLAVGEPRGAEVIEVTGGSAAGAAGVEVGDILLSFNGAEVSDPKGLMLAVRKAPADRTVTMEVWRAGRLVTLTGQAKTLLRQAPVDHVPKDRPEVMAALMAGRCEGWNAQAFFSTATPNAVSGCLTRGADPNEADEAGRTPLDWALATGKREIVRALLAAPEIRANEDLRVNLQALALSAPGSAAERRLQEAAIRQARQGGAEELVDEAAVRRHLARGAAFVKVADNAAGFLHAAAEFRAAARAAPWVAQAHYNLGVVLEQAGRLAAARESYRLYLQAAPQAANAAQVEQHIIELEVREELVPRR